MASPLGVQNRVTAIGETRIGLHGRKYRVVSKGKRKPLPCRRPSPVLGVFQKQFFSERVDAMLWSLQLNRLAVPDPGGFWNTTIPYFRRLLILNSLRSKHKAAYVRSKKKPHPCIKRREGGGE